MCAAIFRQINEPYGPEYDRTGKKLIKTDDQGRTLYPDSSANMHSGPASGSQQSGMKIGGPSGSSTGSYSSGRTDGLKGDAPLTDPNKDNKGPDTSGGTGGINY
mgnify:CR=1 FL=1